MDQSRSLAPTGSLDVRKILGTQEVVTAQHLDEIEIPPQMLGDPGESILTRIRFIGEDATYDVVGWNAKTGALICRRVA